MNTQSKGLAITAIGVLAVVPDALFIRIIDAPVLTIVFWRMFLTGSVVLIWMIAVHGRKYSLVVTRLGTTGAVYSVFSFLAAVFFAFSIELTSVANTVFIIAAMPVFAALASWIWLGEILSRRMIWTLGFALIGLCIIGFANADLTPENRLGDICALGVALCFAIALTAARKARTRSMIPAIPVAYIGGSILLLPFIDPFNIPNDQWWWVAIYGGGFIALSTCLLAIGPRYISSAEVALLILLESILSPILVWAVLGEVPFATTLIGGGLLLVTLCVSNWLALRSQS